MGYEDSSWSAPLHDYFEHDGGFNPISATNVPDTIKAVFNGDDAISRSIGSFQASYGGVTLNHTFQGAPLPLFAYNLYIERTTLSPEPILMLALEPGESKTWSHVLSFAT